MDYYSKYKKYKSKYLTLKSQSGGAKLKYYNVGKKEFEFKFSPSFKIAEATDAIFLGTDMMVITRIGLIYYITNYDTEPVINSVKADMQAAFTASYLE